MEYQAIALSEVKHEYAFLDISRAVAILAVVFIHVTQTISSIYPDVSSKIIWISLFGPRGVQLFFIVSGYTLTLNYINRREALVKFFIRRFFRIFPMFYLGIIIYTFVGAFTTLRFGVHGATYLDYALTFLLLHGWCPHSINRIVPGGWSIAAETMFYMIFPGLLSLVRNIKIVPYAVIASFILSAVSYLLLTRCFPWSAAFQFPSYFWLTQVCAFFSGCALYMAEPFFAKFGKLKSNAAILTLLAVICLINFHKFPGDFLIYVGSFATIVGLFKIYNETASRLTVLINIGKVSFSIYILHFLVASVIGWGIVTLNLNINHDFIFICAYASTFVIAWFFSNFTYAFIEVPLTNIGRQIANKI